MEVDEERKGAVPEPGSVDATKVEEEKEEEETTLRADVGGEETMGTKRSRRVGERGVKPLL